MNATRAYATRCRSRRRLRVSARAIPIAASSRKQATATQPSDDVAEDRRVGFPRALEPGDLSEMIDVIVGEPPCVGEAGARVLRHQRARQQELQQADHQQRGRVGEQQSRRQGDRRRAVAPPAPVAFGDQCGELGGSDRGHHGEPLAADRERCCGTDPEPHQGQHRAIDAGRARRIGRARSSPTSTTAVTARNGHSDWISSLQPSSSGLSVTAPTPTSAGTVPIRGFASRYQHTRTRRRTAPGRREAVEIGAQHGHERSEDQSGIPTGTAAG